MSLSAEESLLLNDIGFNHAGTYCKICYRHFAVGHLRNHFRKKHPAVPLPQATTNQFLRFVITKLDDVKTRYSARDLATNPEKTHKRIICKKCYRTFPHMQNLETHWRSVKIQCCPSDGYTEMKCYKFHCGRYYPIAVPEYHSGQQDRDISVGRSPLSLLTLNSSSPLHAWNSGKDDSMQCSSSLPQNTNQCSLSLPKNTNQCSLGTGGPAFNMSHLTNSTVHDSINPRQQKKVIPGDHRPKSLLLLKSDYESPSQASNPGLAYMQFFEGLPQNNLCSREVVELTLRKIMTKGDDPKYWGKILHTAISTDSSFIENHKSFLLSDALKPNIALKANEHLQCLMDLFNILDSQAKGIVDGIPANLKAKLVKFSNNRDGDNEFEGATSWTFRHREKSSEHVREVRHLLCYLKYIGCPILQKYLSIVSNPLFSSQEAQRSCIIARLMYELAIEGSPNSDYIPVICRFAQFRCFQLKDGSPRLKSPNMCGKVFASVLYVLRFGVLACTSMMLNGGNTSHASGMILHVQGGHVINTISPWVSYCRAMSVRRADTDTSFYAENGDIICNNVTFQKRIYCQLIPLVCSSIRRLFGDIFDSEDWRLFLPESGSCIQVRPYRIELHE